MLLVLTISATTVVIGNWLFRKPFGKLPSRSEKSKLHDVHPIKKGELQNLSNTPPLAPGVSYFSIIKKMLLDKKKSRSPLLINTTKYSKPIINDHEIILTWFGHSSYYVQGKDFRILVDPVLEGSASPFKNLVKPFKFSNNIGIDDIENPTHVIISHDHYDHLDYLSIKKLKQKDCIFICSLGVGAHLRYWGVPSSQIKELIWWQNYSEERLNITACPARHFSGRGLYRNRSLWSSFMLEINDRTIYLGADSGYDQHFKEIASAFPKIDLAILECGQYNTMWPYIHMSPEEVVQAATDLQAAHTLPVHWGKFALAMHPWTEPIERFVAEAEVRSVSYISPQIGENVTLLQDFPREKWWREM